jgi:DNA polymerase (family 10)
LPLANDEIATIFENCADMLQIKGESVHRWLAYRRGAETIREAPRPLNAYLEEGALTDLPGIGKVLAEKIEELLETGKLEFYERLKDEVPIGVLDMMRVNGVGPKKAALFWNELDITDLQQLEEAARANKLQKLSGMGKKSEQKIIDGIEALARQQTDRTPLAEAYPIAHAILNKLLGLEGVTRGEIAGSIRRGRPTIGDVDILIASKRPEAVMNTVVELPEVMQVLGKGETKTSVQLANGLQVDVRVLPEVSYGTALQYFTGSQQHNIRVREIALKAGYSLNEHALTPVDEHGELKEDYAILCSTEQEVYEKIGLTWVPAEIREDRGEIDLAKQDSLPKLIQLTDIRGDLHMHTTYSDGKQSVQEMAEAALERGREYIVITDHSRSLGVANGLSIERLMAQQEEVRRVNAEMGGAIHVFHGTEMDINVDGSMDFPDEILAQLDFVIASLHVSLRQDKESITERMLNAVRNPHVDLIGHPRTQQIGRREPNAVDMDRIFEAAGKTGVALEINANPVRLDLEAQYAQRATEFGIPLCIDTDAHRTEHLDYMYYGVLTARRGWVRAEQVINTWPVERFREWVQRRGNS